jgi:DNA-binding CsgD family transcriptional regulator
MVTAELIGRDAQLEDIAAWLGDPTRLPAGRVLEGDPGIGKTSLMRGAISLAEDAGYRVLRASPVEPESGLAYAALGDLLAGALEDVLPALPEPQREALEAALLLRPAKGHRPEALAVATAFLNGLRALARERPVLVALDDAQWLDAATSDAARFAFRRLRSEAVAILVTRRSRADRRLGIEATGLPSPSTVTVGPLSLGAIHALIVERTVLEPSRPILRQVHELSGGNPFFALELARAIAEGRLRLEPGEPLPMGLRTLVDSRIGGLPSATRWALAACAAMSRPTQRLVGAVIDDGDGLHALAPALAAGVIVETQGGIAFDHPLLASAAYGSLDAGERRRLHARLAGVVPDAAERARHLALAATGPDERVAMALEEAGAATFARAAGADAAQLAALARRLTPAGSEEALARRTYLEAYYRFESGEGDVAADLLEGLIARSGPGPARARLLASLARVRHFQQDVATGVALQRQGLAEAAEDAELRGFLEESLAEGLLLMRTDLGAAWHHARSAARIAETRADDAGLAEALAAVALAEQALGMPRTEAMERALELEPATLHLCVMRQPGFAHGSVLACDDELLRARDVLRTLAQRADDRGNVTSIAPIRNRLSTICCLLGDYDEAERLARESAEFAHQNGQLPSRASALGRLALVLARRGELDEARAAATRALVLAAGPDFDPGHPTHAMSRGGEAALWALGELALSVGDAAEVDRHLGPLTAELLGAGIREPSELRFLGAEIEALVLLGRLEDANRLAGWLATEAARVGRPSTRSGASIARGLLEAACGELAAATRSMEAGVDRARESGMPLELGRALLLLGRVRRRATLKRASRAALEEATEVFDGLGARRWAANAREELGRIGGRAPARGTLSATERQVVALVTRGLSNKEVASALFVTPKAIEANLSRVFAKTGVRSRAELVALAVTEASGAKQ